MMLLTATNIIVKFEILAAELFKKFVTFFIIGKMRASSTVADKQHNPEL